MRVRRYAWIVWVVAAACSRDTTKGGVDLAGIDAGGTPTGFSVRGSTSGLSQGRSTGGTFALSGAIGVPQPRVASTGGAFAVQPLVP